MPIYEYQCKQCAHQLEAIQKMDEPPLSECPKCHQAALEKKVSAAGFQLKGTGWYVTDFKGSHGSTQATETSLEEAAPTKASEKQPSSESQDT